MTGSAWSAFASLWVASRLKLCTGWKSECEVEGVDVQVTLHAPAPVEEQFAGSVQKCQVAYLDHMDLQDPKMDLSGTDVIFTDSLQHAPFAGRSGPVHFIENVSAFFVPDDLDHVMRNKHELLSILLPSSEAWTDLAQTIYSQAQVLMPDHIYFDDGTLEMHTQAFERYRFSLIADGLENRTISLPMVRSVAFHTIPLFNGFVELFAMAFNGVADFIDVNFDLSQTLDTCKKHNEHLGALWHYHRIVQDQMQYRYNRPFEERLLSQACSVCRLRADPSHPPPLAFVGIYSARKNFGKRQAIRETWGRILLDKYNMRYKFFLGGAPEGATREDVQVRHELAVHEDLVFLDIEEGYRMNSRKGLLFLEWIAMRSEAEFLLKVDDDVYFRPVPILEKLQRRPPAGYIWGYFDYVSPVPREEGDHFFNTWEDYPFEVFAPYPRGVVRVLSMDLVRLLAKASRAGKLRMIYGDDPCIGYHLRQLLFDPEEPLPSITLDDFDNKVFAMEPSCHPNLWSKITKRTWVIHHVSPEQIRCMWSADVQAGYYGSEAGKIVVNGEVSPHELPDLCGCATDPSFEERTDLDNLQAETNRILYDED